MSYTPDALSHLTFYLTRPAPCPYLEGRVEQKIFTRLSGDPQSDFFLNSSMNQHGFRRSQTMVYRPACPACMACVPVRIALDQFSLNRNLRRTHAHNEDLITTILHVEKADAFFDLFRTYQSERHGDSDMASMNREDYLAMMQEGGANTSLLTLQNAQGVTLAVMQFDELHHGTSAVYSFYNPQEQSRSLGTELILRLIEHTQAQKKPYVYLGYWIKECRKMAYKSAFPALERLGPNGWEKWRD